MSSSLAPHRFPPVPKTCCGDRPREQDGGRTALRARQGRFWAGWRPKVWFWAAGLLAVGLLPASPWAAAQQPPRKPLRTPLALPRHSATIPPEWLTGISDLTSGFSTDEHGSYYQILARAREGLAEQQQAAAQNLALADREFLADRANRKRQYRLFYDLVTRPDSWRGQPVTLRGYIRDLTPMAAEENQLGLTQLYQAHLFTEDSMQFPYVVVCTEVPPNLPRPEPRRPTDFITVTGYFYKLWTYRAETETGRWSAPLILAGKLEWNPPRGAPPWWQRFGAGAAVGTACLLAGALALLQRRRQQERAVLRQIRGLAQEPPPSEAELRQALEDLSQSDPGPNS